MRQQPLVVQAGPTPLANAFTQISRDLLTANPAKGEAEAAQARKYSAEAAKSEAQLRAMNAVKGKLASIFQQYTADGAPVKPWTNPDTGQLIPNTDTSVPLEPESAVRDRFAAARPDIASLYAQLSNDPMKGLTEGLRVGEMYRGTPDSTRLGALLGGDQPGPDFAGTTAEADRITSRNTSEAIRKDSANPSESQVKGRLLNENWDRLGSLPTEQKKALGALPTKGFSVTAPDGTVVEMGGTSDTAGGLEKPVRTDLQKRTIALDQLDALTNLYEKAVDAAPDASFGSTGIAISLAKDLGFQANNIANALNGAGFTIDKNSPDAPVKQAMNQVITDALAKEDISSEALNNMIAAAESGDEMSQLRTVLLYVASGALTGQEGRGQSDKDINFADKYVQNPRGLASSKPKVKQGIGGLRSISRTMRGSIPSAGVPRPAGATAEAIPTGGTVTPNGGTIPRPQTPEEVAKLQPGTVFIAPDGSQRVR